MSIYSKEFKEEAIRLSDEIGNKKAAAQLGIPYYTLADWRNHSKHKPKGTATMSEEELRIRNRELERENAELREANNILSLSKNAHQARAEMGVFRQTDSTYNKSSFIIYSIKIPAGRAHNSFSFFIVCEIVPFGRRTAS